MKKLIAIALLALLAAAALHTALPAAPHRSAAIQLAGELGDVDPQEKKS
jgi:hypothetical protein